VSTGLWMASFSRVVSNLRKSLAGSDGWTPQFGSGRPSASDAMLPAGALETARDGACAPLVAGASGSGLWQGGR